MFFLVTPALLGPDTVMAVTHDRKAERKIVSLAQPLNIEGHTIVGYADLTASEMTAMTTVSSAILLQHLIRLLLSKADFVLSDDAAFTSAWKQMSRQALTEQGTPSEKQSGAVTALLMSDTDHLFLYTFDLEGDTTVFSFEVPTIYHQGMILTEEEILKQMEQNYTESRWAIQRGFDKDQLHCGIMLP